MRGRLFSGLVAGILAGTGCSDAGPPVARADGVDATAPSADGGGVDAMAPSADVGGDDSGTSASDSGQLPVPSFHLRVLDLDALPIAGAEVRAGGAIRQTDAAGGAGFDGLAPGSVVARVEKTGYAPSTFVGEIPADASSAGEVHLAPFGRPVRFNASSGGPIHKGNIFLRLPSNSLVDPDGHPATGWAEAWIVGIDPSTDALAAAPGPFLGRVRGATAAVELESVFMAEVSLRQNGRPLRLAPGATATLELPVPASLQDAYQVGELIEAWWYDLDMGVWRQEGQGTILRDGTYATGKVWSAQVSHFTWWNCDRQWIEKSCLAVRVLRASDGRPVEGVSVRAVGESYLGETQRATGPDGVACVDIKRGGTVLVAAEHPTLSTQVGGPRRVTGTGVAAACSGQGAACTPVEIRLAGASCVSGRLLDPSGAPAAGVPVHAVVRAGVGRRSSQGTTGAAGEYCMAVPQGATVELRVQRIGPSGGLEAATGTVTAGASEVACGGACSPAPTLALRPIANTSCVTGRAFFETRAPGGQSFVYAGVPRGAPVFVYSSLANGGDFACNSAGSDPTSWGSLISRGTVDAGSRFCVPFSTTASGGARYVVVGDCTTWIGRAPCSGAAELQDVATATRSCGQGDCVDLGDVVVSFACGS